MTGAERQAALRQRRNDRGLYEVRGIYAPLELHGEIKAASDEAMAARYPPTTLQASKKAAAQVTASIASQKASQSDTM